MQASSRRSKQRPPLVRTKRSRSQPTYNMDSEFMKKFDQLVTDASATRQICLEIKADMETLTHEFDKLQSTGEDNNVKLADLAEAQRQLLVRLQELEQYNRKFNVVISGIPHLPENDLEGVVKKLANSLQVPVMEYHIGAIQRLPSKKEPQPIILKLNNLDVKHNLIKSAKLKKVSAEIFGVEDSPIIIEEQLSKETIELFHGARELRDKGIVKFVWCRDGKVLVRESDTSPKITIVDMNQLQHLATKLKNAGERSSPESTSPSTPPLSQVPSTPNNSLDM